VLPIGEQSKASAHDVAQAATKVMEVIGCKVGVGRGFAAASLAGQAQRTIRAVEESPDAAGWAGRAKK